MDERLEWLLRAHRRGVLATIRRDGRPQLSNVGFSYSGDDRLVTISITDDRAKTKNLRRDPRASFHVTTGDMSAYAVAEGEVRLSPVAGDPHDTIVDELVAHYRTVRGEHPDWAEFRQAMVNERRLLARLTVHRVYGWPWRSG